MSPARETWRVQCSGSVCDRLRNEPRAAGAPFFLMRYPLAFFFDTRPSAGASVALTCAGGGASAGGPGLRARCSSRLRGLGGGVRCLASLFARIQVRELLQSLLLLLALQLLFACEAAAPWHAASEHRNDGAFTTATG